MTYTTSIRRRFRDLAQFDFDRGIELLILRNQGWTLEDAGNKLGVSRQRASQIEKMMNGLDVETAELIRDVIGRVGQVIGY